MQARVGSLRVSGREAIHLRSLFDLNATSYLFRELVSSCMGRHGRSVKIIGVFALPIERYRSTFFHLLGDGVARYTPLVNPTMRQSIELMKEE